MTTIADLERPGATSTASQRDAFAQAFEFAPGGMGLVGHDGEWLAVNRALAAMAGRPPRDLLGRPVAESIHPEDREELAARIAELGPGRDRFEVELRVVRPGGRRVAALVSASLLEHDPRTPAQLVLQTQDISARKRMEQRLQRLADRDSLTDLWNRRHFEQDLELQVNRSRRYGEHAALLLLDLDHFKDVNDSFGHRVGDDLLKEVAAALRAHTRDSDVVARLGGDEFAVLLLGVHQLEAQATAQKLVAAAREARVTAQGTEVAASASVGVALIDDQATTPEDVFVAADMAMYEAKADGRGRASVSAHHEARRRASGGLRWSQRVREALRHDAFEVHAQPIVSVEDGSTWCYELLARLRDQDGQLLTGSQFMYHAERFGYAPAIDRWILGRAAHHAVAFRRAGRPARFAVNVAAASLRDRGFATDVERILRHSGVDPSALCFEISETAAVASLDAARRFSVQVGALGCMVALDDFGAGLANFTYIKSVPFDIIKIDGDFIRGLSDNLTDNLVVHSVVDIAHGLGKRTVAEYVADEQTLAAVRAAGIDYAQGNHTGAPHPLD